jgi:iron(II)-dependent oxidoreductase
VTNAQYAYFLNDIGILYDEANVYYSIKDPVSKIVFLHGLYRFYRGTARYPVFNVSYYGAKAFCERYGKRLATADEWREAIGYRKDHRDFPWGADRDFDRRANFLGEQDGYRLWAPVDAFPEGRSPYGVYNMAGNMWEWLDRSKIMGGAWDFPPEPYGRVSFTDDNAPYARNTHDGFRCVSDRKISD